MERLGFEIDPSLLVTLVSRQLKMRSHLNDAELSIFWYQRERHKKCPVVLVADPSSIGIKVDEIKTRANYRVELWAAADGRPAMLQSFAPKYRAGCNSFGRLGKAA
jgi:hypothetical protein